MYLCTCVWKLCACLMSVYKSKRPLFFNSTLFSFVYFFYKFSILVKGKKLLCECICVIFYEPCYFIRVTKMVKEKIHIINNFTISLFCKRVTNKFCWDPSCLPRFYMPNSGWWLYCCMFLYKRHLNERTTKSDGRFLP